MALAERDTMLREKYNDLSSSASPSFLLTLLLPLLQLLLLLNFRRNEQLCIDPSWPTLSIRLASYLKHCPIVSRSFTCIRIRLGG